MVMRKLLKTIPPLAFGLGAVAGLSALTGIAPWPVPAVIAFMLAAAAVGYSSSIINLTKSESAAASSQRRIDTEVLDLKNDIRELARTNARYERLMAATNDAVSLVDEAGRIIEANRSMAELLGYETKELAGHFLPDLAPATERNRLKAFITAALDDGVAQAEDVMLNHQDGSSFWFDGSAGLIENEPGPVIQMVFRDITERKRQFVLTEKEISFLHELSRTLPLLQDFDQMLDRILGMLSDTLPFNAFTLVLAEPNDTRATICVSSKTKKPFLNDVRACVADVLSELGDNIDPNEVEYVIERKTNIEPPAESSVGSQILLPLAIVNGVAGLFSSEPNAFKKEDLSLFSTMVSGISSLYIAYRSYQQVQHLSETDSLTALFNRRKFFEELHREVERVSRYEAPLTLIMLDIDHFKKVNDEYGHQMGDEVLRTLSDVLRANTRKTDVVARYGGEEFIIMLTETPIKGALGVADRIKSEVEKTAVLGAAVEINFTVSLGLADFTQGDTVDTLVARTDQALYAAKKNGRNRVELIQA